MNERVYFEFPVIEIGDITLREITKDDVKAFYSYISDKRVNRYIAEDDVPKNIESAEKELMYWADLYTYRRSIYWGIVKTKNNILIGTCGYNNWSRMHKRGEISYDLAHSYWGKGISTRCVKAISDFGFAAMGLQRIQATVAIDNIGSIKVLEKSNYKREGLMRSYGILHGQAKDFYMYSTLREDQVF